jgi:predicted SnoaL-like aldol condensation-catalyzing enzyme
VRNRVVLVAIAVALQIASGAAQQSLAANKQLINDFFSFTGPREERAMRFMAETYKQHNPRFLKMDTYTGAQGWRAWVAANEQAQKLGNLQLVALGGIALRNPIILIGEGDLALAVYRGTLPERDAPGERYEAFAFEAFRFANGQFTEHWDQVRLTPGWMTPRQPNAPAAGARAGGAAQPAAARPAPPVAEPQPGCTASAATIAANKALVTGLALGKRRGLTRELLIAECDFVAQVWKQVLPDPDQPGRTWEAFLFDAFRIRNGQLAEHWDESTR